jgi:multidrug resistance efflux pump
MDVQRQPKSKRSRTTVLAASAAGLILATIALSRVEPASPTVKRSTVSIDTVKRGLMVRQVRGPGNLVPEQIRYITTLTPGRVERILVRPGTAVTAGTVLLELGNPDVHIQALESEQQLTASQAQLVSMKLGLENQRWTQESNLASVRREYEDAVRQARTSEELAKKGMIAGVELDRARDRAKELSTRMEVEQKRLDAIIASIGPQMDVQREQVRRLSAISAFQRGQVASMRVQAGANGVLQELPLEVGQWVTSGMTLAVVAQPGKLKAVLHVPETQARDVVMSQPASVDTRNGVVKGRVIRIDPAVQNGTVVVEVAFDGALPAGARPDMSVDGTIEVERLNDVLYVGRPVNGNAESATKLFRLDPDGRHATRVPVRLGRGSVNAIEIRGGLKAGDQVILSDMSEWDEHDRVRLR